MNVLLIHGNGGSPARFEAALEQLRKLRPRWHFAVAELSGFGGKELPKTEEYWDIFLDDLYRAVEGKTLEPWFVFAQGTGAAIVLEFARRDWEFPNGYILRPRKTILYGGAGIALDRRLRSRMLRVPFFRQIAKWLLQVGFLKKMWAKRFFQAPEKVSDAQKERFFQDLKSGQAFSLFFELVTRQWYEEARADAWHQRFDFCWGSADRIVSIKWMGQWKKDFPKSNFHTIEGWDHFPMLEDPEGFARFLVNEEGN